jgi:hypothetical protein
VLVAVSVKVLLLFTLTVLEVPVTSPIPDSMLNFVASLTSQLRVTLPPPAGKLGGVAVKLFMIGLDLLGGLELGQAVSARIMPRKDINRAIFFIIPPF